MTVMNPRPTEHLTSTIVVPTRPLEHLTPLSGVSHYDVERGSLDPRGWTTLGSDRMPVGAVHDLLVDVDARQVLYLVVVLDGSLTDRPGDYHVVVPVEAVSFEERKRFVVLRSMAAASVARLPYHYELPFAYDARLPFLGASAGLTEDTTAAPEITIAPKRMAALPWVVAAGVITVLVLASLAALLPEGGDVGAVHPDPPLTQTATG